MSRPSFQRSRSNSGLGSDPAKASERKIELVLRLRKLVRALPAFVAALRNTGSSVLLSTAASVFADDRHEDMARCVDETINDDAVGGFGKGPLAARNARLFAVRSEHRRLLEVARATYLENVQDLNALLEGLKTQFELPSAALNYTSSGYMLQADREVRGPLFLLSVPLPEFSCLGIRCPIPYAPGLDQRSQCTTPPNMPSFMLCCSCIHRPNERRK